MVKLTGPVLSRAASGTLGNALTFQKSGKSHTLRKKPTPKQPRSGLQVSMRAMMSFLSKQWKNITPYQNSWANAYPHEPDLNNYNAYIRFNLERWRTRRPPTQGYPTLEHQTIGTQPDIYAAGQVRHAKILVYLDGDINDNWTFLIFHAIGAWPDLAVDRLIHVELTIDLLDKHFTHTPLAAATHYYRAVATAGDGNVNWTINVGSAAVVT